MARWRRTRQQAGSALVVSLCVVAVLVAGSWPFFALTSPRHVGAAAPGEIPSSARSRCGGDPQPAGGSRIAGVIEPRGCLPAPARLAAATTDSGGFAPSTSWSPTRTLAWSAASAPPVTVGEGAGFATDSAGDEALLFGGQQGGTLLNSTQLYNESTDHWNNLTLPSAPSPRSYFAFGAGASDRVAVLFGGVVNATTLRVDNATWLYRFSTGTWANVTGAVAPEAREDAAFAIDPGGGFGLLYGGWNQDYSPTSSITYSDLWRFDLATDAWAQVTVEGASSPPPLHGASLTWDPQAGRFDLFGGCYPCSSAVWQYDPENDDWSHLTGPSGTVPAPRADDSWSWDPVASADVLFGGTNGIDWFNDTYEFLPTQDEWIQETPSVAPSPRFAAASAWLNESGNQTLLLSGGNSSQPLGPDLWRLAPTSNLSVLALNASSLLPLEDANVSVDQAPALPTSAAGYLNLTEVVAAETSLNVTRLGYAANASTFWIAPASSTSVEYRLSPVAPVRLDVRAYSVAGKPLDNVTVKVSVQGEAAPGSPNATNSEGYANFTGVPSEIPVPMAVVVATAPENYSNQTLVAIPPGTEVQAVLVLTPFPFVDLRVLGTLANGTVVPVHAAVVFENGLPFGTTSPSGWINGTSLASGDVAFTVTADGFLPTFRYVPLPRTGNTTVELMMTGDLFGTLEVWVLEAVSLRPVPNATVEATSVLALSSVNAGASAPSNDTGWATLSLPEATYEVRVTAYGYYPSTPVEVRVRSNLTSDLLVYLQLLPGATVDVLVHDANTQAPLSSAIVLLGNLQGGVTDGNGWANFTNVHFGLTDVNVSRPGYDPNYTVVRFAPGEVLREYLVNLTPGVMGSGGPPGPFGAGFPPSVASLWPYLVVLAVMLVGAMIYLAYLRSPRNESPRPDRRAPRSSSTVPRKGPPPAAR